MHSRSIALVELSGWACYCYIVGCGTCCTSMTNFDVCVVYCYVYSWSLSGYLNLNVHTLGAQHLYALATPFLSHSLFFTLPLHSLSWSPSMPHHSLWLFLCIFCLERHLPTVHNNAATFELWTAEFVSAMVCPSFSFVHSCSLTGLSSVPSMPLLLPMLT